MITGHRTTGAVTAVLAIAALTTACGSVHMNRAAGAKRSPAAAAVLRSAVMDGCPATLPAHLSSDVSGTARTLEPLRADRLALCGYGGSPRGTAHPLSLSRHALVDDRSTVDGLRAEFNSLGPVPKVRFSCPFDSGAKVVAIFTDGSHEVQLRDSVTGCSTVTNGDLTRWVGSSKVNTTIRGLLDHVSPGG